MCRRKLKLTCSCNGLNGVRLANDGVAENLFELEQLFGFGRQQARNRNSGPKFGAIASESEIGIGAMVATTLKKKSNFFLHF